MFCYVLFVDIADGSDHFFYLLLLGVYWKMKSVIMFIVIILDANEGCLQEFFLMFLEFVFPLEAKNLLSSDVVHDPLFNQLLSSFWGFGGITRIFGLHWGVNINGMILF